MRKEQEKLAQICKRQLEINVKKRELTENLDKKSSEDLDSIKEEIKVLTDEQNALEEEKIKLEEKIKILEIGSKNITDKSEDKNMTEDIRELRSSKLYETAWAKTLMKRKLNNNESSIFTKVNGGEKARALGIATTTTATDYVEASESADGINNGGVATPTDVNTRILNKLESESPIFAKITKMSYGGNLSLVVEDEETGAKWYAEGTCTEDSQTKFSTIALTGFELAKFENVSWKVERMSVDGFIDFIINKIAKSMRKALINAVIYGKGSSDNQPEGLTLKATKLTYAADTMLDVLENSVSKLNYNNRIGAELYVSPSIMNKICFAKDKNGRYQFNALVKPDYFGSVKINVDEYLKDDDAVFTNPENYILNSVEDITVLNDKDNKCRRNNYSGYGIFDGKASPDSVIYITKTSV